MILASGSADAREGADPHARIQARGPVQALAVGGSTVAFEMETPDAYGVWSLADGHVRLVRPGRGDEAQEDAGLAVLSGGVVVWGTVSETNHYTLGISFARAAAPNVVRELFYSPYDSYLGSMAADGATLAFSTQSGEYYGGAHARLYVGNTRRVTVVRNVTGWMDHVAVEGARIGVGYRNGRVDVLGLTGRLSLVLPAGTAPRGIALDGGRLVALSERNASLRRLSDGRPIRVHALQRPGKNVTLQDAQRGLIVYRAGQELRLVRLSDGRERVLAKSGTPETLHAQFSPVGLVISHDRVVELIPVAELVSLLNAGR